MTSVSYTGNRDRRFVTVGRGGLLDDRTHHLLTLWAAACAERVLPLFHTACPDDQRPGDAIDVARQWAAGEATMMTAREQAFAAHAAARSTVGAARDAARAAGHAVATAHIADHELGGAFYALRALAKAHPGDQRRLEEERRWQLIILPEQIKFLVIDDMRCRAKKFQNAFQLAE
jgi:hypothetical protein